MRKTQMRSTKNLKSESSPTFPRRKELELYRLFATNDEFKLGLMENIQMALRAGV